MTNEEAKNKAVYNSFYGLLNRLVILILGMVFRRVLIRNLGDDISGLTGLYQNILDFLKLTTAGLASSAIYNIYQLRAKNDEEGIAKLVKFITYFYYTVVTVIFTLGIIFSVFIDSFIYNNTYPLYYLRILFMLQILSECVSDLFYSRNLLLQATNDSNVLSKIEMTISVIYYVVCIGAIIIWKSVPLYLMILIGKNLIIGILVYVKAGKMYPGMVRKDVTIHFSEFKPIIFQTKDTIIIQISNFIFLSTDSLVISKWLGLSDVNKYNNYLIIFNALITFIDEVNGSIRNSYGNLLAEKNSSTQRLSFVETSCILSSVIGVFCISELSGLVDDFIELWIGKSYVLPVIVVSIFILNFFTQNIGYGLKNYLLLNGRFHANGIIMLVGAIVNIVLSIALVQSYGILGVIIGTFCGNLIMNVLRTIFFYKKDVNSSPNYFLAQSIKGLLLSIFVFCIAFLVKRLLAGYAVLPRFIATLIISTIVPFIVCHFAYRKNGTYEYLVAYLKGLVKKLSDDIQRKNQE